MTKDRCPQHPGAPQKRIPNQPDWVRCSPKNGAACKWTRPAEKAGRR